jgi:hypothetical protein
MGVEGRLTVAGGGDDGIVIAPAGTDRDDVTGLWDTGVNLADRKSALRPTADAAYDVSTAVRDVRPNTVVVDSDAAGADTFILKFYIRGDTSSPYVTGALQDDDNAATIQTAIRAALPGTDLTTVVGDSPSPFTITFDPAVYSGPFPKVIFVGTGCTATVVSGGTSVAADAQIGALGESHRVSATDSILKPTIGTITVTGGTDAVHSLAYSAGTDGGTVSLGYRAGAVPGVQGPLGGVTGGLAFDAYVSEVQAALAAIAGANAPTASIFSGAEVATIDLGDIGAGDTFKLTYNGVEGATITGDTDLADAVVMQARVNTLLGGAGRATVARVDGNTFTVTRLKSGAFASTFTVTSTATFTPLGTGGYTAGGKITTAAGDLVWYFTFENGSEAGRPVPLNRLYVSSDLLTDGGVAESATLASVTAGVLGSISAAYTENGAGDTVLTAAIADVGGKSYGFAGDASTPVVIAGIPPGAYHLVQRTVEDGRVSKADSKAFTMTSA